MSEVRVLIETLIDQGVDPVTAAEVVARAAIEGAMTVGPVTSKAAQRQKRYRERNKASQNVTNRNEVTVSDGGDEPEQKEVPPHPPKKNYTSEPNGSSDATASDYRTVLFTEGRQSLQRQTGKREGQIRSLLGKWLKASNDDARRILDAILDAERQNVADPVAWVTRCLGPPGKPDTHHTRMMTALAKLAENGPTDQSQSPHGTIHSLPGARQVGH